MRQETKKTVPAPSPTPTPNPLPVTIPSHITPMQLDFAFPIQPFNVFPVPSIQSPAPNTPTKENDSQSMKVITAQVTSKFHSPMALSLFLVKTEQRR